MNAHGPLCARLAQLLAVMLCASIPACADETVSTEMSVPVRGARVVVYRRDRRGAFKDVSIVSRRAVVERYVLGIPIRKTLVDYDTGPLEVEALNDSTARVSRRGGASAEWKTFTIPHRFLNNRARSVFGGGRSSSPEKAAGCWVLHWRNWGQPMWDWGDSLELRTEHAGFAGLGDYAYRVEPVAHDRPKGRGLLSGDLETYWEHGFPEHWWQPIDDDHFMITLRRPASQFPGSGRRVVMWIGPPDAAAHARDFTAAGRVYTYREDATADNVGPQDTWLSLRHISCAGTGAG